MGCLSGWDKNECCPPFFFVFQPANCHQSYISSLLHYQLSLLIFKMAAPAPAPAQTNTHNSGPIDHNDLEEWKSRFNDVLARPSEHVNSKSPETSQPWQNSFFGCFSPISLCAITCCVPCVTFGKTHHRLQKNKNLEGYEPVNTSVCLPIHQNIEIKMY